ncbi:hypothetical protein HHK36_017764 [Tetracentron sinense]|uniref:carotenoid 9,10-dioxygenase n=1 Tax=Tetracentron sinense TaxID=13715 RepID=A0A835DAN2_TETSI|nr:hypothetical protein HHK36_017764 [Tetracentron sinense]
MAEKTKEEKLQSSNGGGIVVVDPKPNKGIASKFVDLVEKLIVKFMYDPSQPPHYLSGNFAPVSDETPPCKNLLVKGYLPECLNGEFIRVGPNPKFAPVAGYNCMIHGMRIKDGKATYVSRYVRTSRLKQEQFFGGSKFLKIGDLKGIFGLLMVNMQILREKLKVLDISYGIGAGNTALIYHHGKLLALSEIDKPYILKVLEDGDLQTLGMLDYDKRLAHSFTAHPKVDPFTGEMFTFGYSHTPPYITYRVISNDGFMHDPVPITIPEPILMHDFSITENYAIFMDLPLYFRPKAYKMIRLNIELLISSFKMAKNIRSTGTTGGGSSTNDSGTGEIPTRDSRVDGSSTMYSRVYGRSTGDSRADGSFTGGKMVKENKSIYTFDATKKARFGILPRYAKNDLQIRWFELPNCFIFHNANAWEEEDDVVLITCRLKNPDVDLVNENFKEKPENFTTELYEMRFNMKTGVASQKKLSVPTVEFPRVNESYTGRYSTDKEQVVFHDVAKASDYGQFSLCCLSCTKFRKQRFVYGSQNNVVKVTGIIKFDLHDEPDTGKTMLEVGGNVQGIFDLGAGRLGSEAIFVPREPGITSEEDDGYLIFFLHDEKNGKSAVNVIDAKTMSAEPVAVIELPHRVPYGFHAFFVTEVGIKVIQSNTFFHKIHITFVDSKAK